MTRKYQALPLETIRDMLDRRIPELILNHQLKIKFAESQILDLEIERDKLIAELTERRLESASRRRATEVLMWRYWNRKDIRFRFVE